MSILADNPTPIVSLDVAALIRDIIPRIMTAIQRIRSTIESQAN
jgi:hypothetical protein